MKTCILSASRTLDGVPVYLSPAQEWIEDFQGAYVFQEREELDAAIGRARAMEDRLCEPFQILVKTEDGVLRATQGKWAMRAEGAAKMLTSLGYENIGSDDHVSV